MMEKISQETFETEIEMCKKHFQKKQCCAWGKCENCGVVPLLVKLHEGGIVDNKQDIEALKEMYFTDKQ
jgi:hypothetical protein